MITRLLFAASVVVTFLFGPATIAGAATPSQFTDQLKAGQLKPFVPRASDTTPVTVVVLMSGDSVAVAQKNAGRALGSADRNTIASARRAEHSAAMPEIRRRGGRVLGSFTGALNGIKITIARNQVDSLRSIPGVVDVKPVGRYHLNNAVSVPYIGAPQVWQLPQHLQGQGIKVAIIDTGIDYTHADFGGPGTVAAFKTAQATSTSAADPALFGPSAPKVKGGIDLVGDAYDPEGTGDAQIPHPDPNPLDCEGHGSHVAGTAAGFGVKADGTTFTGPYGPDAYSPGAFKIGPGVAPMADLYAVRVFGCSGTTDLVSDAIDWAVNNGMNVINMSLGADWGSADDSESVAVANAIAAGIVVVVSQGNGGPFPYIGGSPASIDGTVSVASMDSTAAYPGATLALSGVANPVVVQDSNGAPFTNGASWPIVVLRNANGTVSFGCSEAEYDRTRNGGVDIAGRLVIAVRGSTCARVFRAGAGQHFGAAAVLLINNAAGYPSYEGPIPGGDPAGNPYEPVTIPFFGALASDTARLTGPTGGPAPQTAVANNITLANPTFQTVSSFSSGGPRIGDSVLRPALTAPGASIVSAASGTGSESHTLSGTSMAAPHVAGVAALVKQANPTWPVADLRAAIVQATAPDKLTDYSPRLEGSGVVQPLAAVQTQAIVRAPNENLSYGYSDLLEDFSSTQQVTIHNTGPKATQFNLSATRSVGPAGATISMPSSVAVRGNGDAVFPVTLNVPAASIGGTHATDGTCCLFHEVGGTIRVTPSTSRLNADVSLTLPYYFVPRTRSNLVTNATSVLGLPTGANNLTVSNPSGVLAGTPDFYTLGLQSAPQGVAFADVRAVGVQSIRISSSDRLLVFAINTFARISNPSGRLEWDIYIDTTGTGVPDYVLALSDGVGFTSAAAAQHKLTGALIRLSDNTITALRLADAATDNSTILAAILASEIGLSTSKPRFSYVEVHFGSDGRVAQMPGTARFNAFTPALSVTDGIEIAPNASAPSTVVVNAAEMLVTPPLGLMIVAPDNRSGPSQARIVPLRPTSP